MKRPAQPKFKTVRVSAIEGTPNAERERIKIYTAEIPAETVASFYVDRALDVEGGFQRQLDANRAAKIGRLMAGVAKTKEEPAPNIQGALLAFAETGDVSFRNGMLTIKKPLGLLDGQHRAAGDRWAVENGYWHEYTETTKIVTGATRAELAIWYLRTNMLARKVEPSNILLNVAMQTGVVMNRKSWLAREAIVLATDAPFIIEVPTGEGEDTETKRIVSFARRDGGQIKALTLYKALNFLLPEEMNKAGTEIETEAVEYATDAFSLYSTLFGDAWGKVDAETQALVPHDCYEFTMMAAFARLYKAVRIAAGKDTSTVDGAIRRAWTASGYSDGVPEHVGSGERAALAMANYAAGHIDLPLKVAIAA